MSHDGTSNEKSTSRRSQVDFGGFLLSLGTNCMAHLGKRPHPETGQTSVNRPAAREVLDLLHVLQTKTAGILSDREDQLLKTLLRDLEKAFDDTES